MATYDPKQVTVSFGNLILGDFGPDTFINITRDGDDFEAKQGAAGATEWVNKNSNIHNIEFTLLQTSPINDSLSAALEADRSGNGGAKSFQVKDAGGTTVVSFGEARIVKPANVEYSASSNARTWTLKATKASSFNIGGIPAV